VEAEEPYVDIQVVTSLDENYNELLDTAVDDSQTEKGKGF
jgi:hypothetical protein